MEKQNLNKEWLKTLSIKLKLTSATKTLKFIKENSQTKIKWLQVHITEQKHNLSKIFCFILCCS